MSKISESLMKITLDKKSYHLGDVLVISGSVVFAKNNESVTIMILSPDNSVIQVEQIPVSADGKFSIPIRVDGPLWKSPGNYTVIAQGGFKHVSSQSTFEFEKPLISSSSTILVQENQTRQSFNVNYTITGGIVRIISVEPQEIALVLKISSENHGSIHLQIPRQLLDAKTNSSRDIPYLVFVNDNEVESAIEEKTDDIYRTLEVPFSDGISEIKIIGTVVVPEFASLANLIFVISIIGILIFPIIVLKKFNCISSSNLFRNQRNFRDDISILKCE